MRSTKLLTNRLDNYGTNERRVGAKPASNVRRMYNVRLSFEYVDKVDVPTRPVKLDINTLIINNSCN